MWVPSALDATSFNHISAIDVGAFDDSIATRAFGAPQFDVQRKAWNNANPNMGV
jgi:hypothetical protein